MTRIPLLLLVLLLSLTFIEASKNDGDGQHVEKPRTYRKRPIPGKATADSSTSSSKHVRQVREPRIVGGLKTGPNTYPFFVRIDNAKTNVRGICGGNLVAPDVVLTAGHCWKPSMKAVVNGYNRSNKRTRNQKSRRVERKVRHPRYNGTTWDYDYLLLKLKSKVDIEPIPLNLNATFPQVGDDLIAVGLGRRTEAGNLSFALRHVTIPATNQTACVESYAKIGRNVTLNNMFCAGAPEKSPCKGDSGGPLLSSGENKTLVGIISWGAGCGRQNFPTVYARITGVQTWLVRNICNISDYPPDWCPPPTLPGAKDGEPSPTSSPTPRPTPVEIPIKTPAIRGSPRPTPSALPPTPKASAKGAPPTPKATPKPTRSKATSPPTPKAAPKTTREPTLRATGNKPPTPPPPPTPKAKTTPPPTKKAAAAVRTTPPPSPAVTNAKRPGALASNGNPGGSSTEPPPTYNVAP